MPKNYAHNALGEAGFVTSTLLAQSSYMVGLLRYKDLLVFMEVLSSMVSSGGCNPLTFMFIGSNPITSTNFNVTVAEMD